MKTEIKVALITAAAGLAGNLITAYGPAVLSWGQKPIFATSEIYKDLKQENPQLEETLMEQLLQREIYYTYRRTEIVFKRLEGGNVVIEAKNITRLRNSKTDPKKYQHVVSFNNTVSYEEVIVRPQTGSSIAYPKNQIVQMPMEGTGLEKSYTLPEVVIPGHGSIEVESTFLVTKPNKKNETAFVTGRFVNAPMTFIIRNEINDPRFTYDWSSLAFSLRLPTDRGSKKNEASITIPGPVFSGQGLSVSWDTN